jgi:hypothetical protein
MTYKIPALVPNAFIPGLGPYTVGHSCPCCEKQFEPRPGSREPGSKGKNGKITGSRENQRMANVKSRGTRATAAMEK